MDGLSTSFAQFRLFHLYFSWRVCDSHLHLAKVLVLYALFFVHASGVKWVGCKRKVHSITRTSNFLVRVNLLIFITLCYDLLVFIRVAHKWRSLQPVSVCPVYLTSECKGQLHCPWHISSNKVYTNVLKSI